MIARQNNNNYNNDSDGIINVLKVYINIYLI